MIVLRALWAVGFVPILCVLLVLMFLVLFVGLPLIALLWIVSGYPMERQLDWMFIDLPDAIVGWYITLF